MKIFKNIIVSVFILSISMNIEAAIVKNNEEAKSAYSIALYHRDIAVSKFSNNEDGSYDIERSNEILKDILKFETIEEVYTTLSENYEMLGDYKNSIKTFEDILKKDIYNIDVLVRLAQKYFFIFQNYDKAEYYTKKAFEIEPYNNNVLLLLGYINYDKYKNYTLACYYFSKIDDSAYISSEFSLIDYNIYYSLAAFYNGMFELAREKMQKVSKVDLNSKNYLYNVITKSSQVLEDYKQAYKVALNVYEDYGEEEALYYAAFLSVVSDDYNKMLFDRISKSRRAYPKIIQIASLVTNEDGALNAISELEKEFENGNFDLDLIQLYYYLVSKYSDESTVLEAKKFISDFYLSLGSYESVMLHLNDIARNSVDNEEDSNTVLAMYIKVIEGFYKNKDYKTTKNVIEEYLEILNIYNSREEAYYVYIIQTLYSINEYDLSLSVLNTLDQKMENKNFKYDSLKAYVYSLKGDKDNTQKYINSYLENADTTKDKNIMNDLNILYMAGFNIKDSVLTEKVARLIYSIDNTSAASHNTLAWALIDFDINVDEGMKLSKEAIKLADSENVIYYLDTLAWGYYKKGEYEEALKILLNVLFKIDENNKEANIEIFMHTADTYYAIGDSDMALTYYLKARASMFDTNNEYKDKANDMIDKLKK